MLKFALIALVMLQVVQYLVIARRALFKPGPMLLRFEPRNALTYGIHYGVVVTVLLLVLIRGYQP